MYISANMDAVTDLTPRQIQILKAIIDEYIATAEAVGSETLEKKHNLGVSPATIRNEMVRLTELGMLSQPHTSSGRAPTPVALKYYVDQLMKPKDLSVAEEVAVKEKVWNYRQEIDKLLREATKPLQKNQNTRRTATNEGDLYYPAANILTCRNFYDYQLTHDLLGTLDEYDFWWHVLNFILIRFLFCLVTIVDRRLTQCGFVYYKFKTPHVGSYQRGGPSR